MREWNRSAAVENSHIPILVAERLPPILVADLFGDAPEP